MSRRIQALRDAIDRHGRALADLCAAPIGPAGARAATRTIEAAAELERAIADVAAKLDAAADPDRPQPDAIVQGLSMGSRRDVATPLGTTRGSCTSVLEVRAAALGGPLHVKIEAEHPEHLPPGDLARAAIAALDAATRWLP